MATYASTHTRPVFIGCPEDVAGFVSKYFIDVVWPPAIVRIAHHHFFDDRVGEVVKRVFGEKGHVCPVCVLT